MENKKDRQRYRQNFRIVEKDQIKKICQESLNNLNEVRKIFLGWDEEGFFLIKETSSKDFHPAVFVILYFAYKWK